MKFKSNYANQITKNKTNDFKDNIRFLEKCATEGLIALAVRYKHRYLMDRGYEKHYIEIKKELNPDS